MKIKLYTDSRNFKSSLTRAWDKEVDGAVYCTDCDEPLTESEIDFGKCNCQTIYSDYAQSD